MTHLVTQKVVFKPGQVIIQEKTLGQAIFIIESGQVEVYRLNSEHSKIPLGLVGKGQYLGEMSLLKGGNHTASAVALTEVRAIQLSKEAIDEQLRLAPAWLVALTRGLVYRLMQMNNILTKHQIKDDLLVNAIESIENEENLQKEKLEKKSAS